MTKTLAAAVFLAAALVPRCSGGGPESATTTCSWDSAKGTAAPDGKTACRAMAPDVSLTAAVTGTRASEPPSQSVVVRCDFWGAF